MERLDVEHNNIRAAIDWYRQEDPPAALRLAAAMSMFWSLHGHYTEGRQLLRQLLGLVPDQTTVRVRALNGAAWLAIDQGDYPDADRLLSESTELSGRLNDKVGEGMAAAFLCRSMLSSGRVAEAAQYSQRAYAALTEADDGPGIAFALFYLALNAQFTGNLEAACDLHERCAAMCRELGFASLRARALQLLGITRLLRGDLKAARAALQEGLPASVDLGDRFVIPIGKPRLSLDLSRNGTRFGFMLDIPQHQTECLLRARVAELGGVIEQRAELTGLTDDAAGVAARVRDAGGQTHVITAGYVVGCDGAHSRVRHELGLRFQGHPYPQAWLLADVRLDWARPEDVVHAFFRADGLPLVCFPMRDHTWRLVVPFAGDRAPGAPGLGEIQQLVDQRAPEQVAVSDPTWLASFNCHRRSTNVYRRGHVLLAGDAVHIHTPAGGQGMNTGITDAHNLGWKLALVAAGRAPGQLLDTYGPRTRACRGPGAWPHAHAGAVRYHDPSGETGAPGYDRPGRLPGRPDPPACGPPLDPGQCRLPRQ